MTLQEFQLFCQDALGREIAIGGSGCQALRTCGLDLLDVVALEGAIVQEYGPVEFPSEDNTVELDWWFAELYHFVAAAYDRRDTPEYVQ